MYYINYFFIFSIIGHLIETILSSESGFLYGCWTPVYGIGVVLILLIHKILDKTFKKNNLNKYLKALILFITCCIILSLIEAISGYLLKWIFNIEMWDYSNYKFNIGKYAAVEMGLIWGTSSLILIYLIKPIVDKFVNKIPRILTYILIILFIIDCISTFIAKTVVK